MADPHFPGCVVIASTQLRAETLSRYLAMANALWMAGDRARYDRQLAHAMRIMNEIADDRAAILKEQG